MRGCCRCPCGEVVLLSGPLTGLKGAKAKGTPNEIQKTSLPPPPLPSQPTTRSKPTAKRSVQGHAGSIPGTGPAAQPAPRPFPILLPAGPSQANARHDLADKRWASRGHRQQCQSFAHVSIEGLASVCRLMTHLSRIHFYYFIYFTPK